MEQSPRRIVLVSFQHRDNNKQDLKKCAPWQNADISVEPISVAQNNKAHSMPVCVAMYSTKTGQITRDPPGASGLP